VGPSAWWGPSAWRSPLFADTLELAFPLLRHELAGLLAALGPVLLPHRLGFELGTLAHGALAKRDIVQNVIDLFTQVGLGTPRVAILSAVETVTPKIPSTIDAAALCKMAERGQITGGILDGPLAFDNAIDPEAAKIKGITSAVAGRAQILVVPDLEAGNMLAKNLTFLAKADAAGMVLGARVPIILTSRADSVRSRMASCAAAVLYADARRRIACCCNLLDRRLASRVRPQLSHVCL
jgi:hypothetical protein